MDKNKKALAVIVLYRCSPNESETIKSFVKAKNVLPKVLEKVVVYDNSGFDYEYTEDEIRTLIGLNVEIVRDNSNSGLSRAYNVALSIATKKNIQFLMMLDQDTSLTKHYFECMQKEIEQNSYATVFVPYVCDQNNKPISPSYVKLTGRVKAFSIDNNIMSNVEITAINSGLILKTDFLNKIGGFSDKYKLDMLDHWLFKMINKEGKTIRLCNISIVHDLSVFALDEVSYNRYTNIIKSELMFNNEFASNIELISYYIRNLYRIIGHILKKRYKLSMIIVRTIFMVKKSVT